MYGSTVGIGRKISGEICRCGARCYQGPAERVKLSCTSQVYDHINNDWFFLLKMLQTLLLRNTVVLV